MIITYTSMIPKCGTFSLLEENKNAIIIKRSHTAIFTFKVKQADITKQENFLCSLFCETNLFNSQDDRMIMCHL